MVSTKDALNHEVQISYGDSFSDDNNLRNTFAYPTTVTDPDGYSSTMKYHFDFGAVTYRRTPQPNTTEHLAGPEQTITYDANGRVQQITNLVNNAYTRFEYPTSDIRVDTYTTIQEGLGEAHSFQITDGAGQVIATAADHPGSTGGFSGQRFVYDVMGRLIKTSNPTETYASGTPFQWITAGDDETAGWIYTQQTYDWKGRPLVTTNQDGTTKTASYTGCGCAGGEVVTLTDEGTLDGGVAKRRQQKIYSDVLGRTRKTEILNWAGGSGYATTVNTYNARDQVTQIRELAGDESSSTYQDTIMTYDGYGRQRTKHVPEQSSGTNTTWDYNSDDTVQTVTDARGAATNYSYNNRHLVTGLTYSVPSGSEIPVPAAVSFAYDAANNRTSMTDGTGSTTYSYDLLSRMTSESRTFNGVAGTYVLDYAYNLGNELTTLSIPFRSQQIGYNYDIAGRLSDVTASGFTAKYPGLPTQTLTNFASNITYRAWGARKSMTYGNTTSEHLNYDSRLRPTTYTLSNMNYQNTNVCCSYPTYNTMTWTFGYYDDGRVKQAWDATNEWFDRAYKYDHAGRLNEATTYRRAHGLTPYPAINYPDPYYQSIAYDAFDHITSRTGRFYTGEPTDSGTYLSNRRTGWFYDDQGNTIFDGSYQQTFDATGTQSHSVSYSAVGDGAQYPVQPRLDLTQTYDGMGAPTKRVQISRQPGVVDESGNQGPPIADTQTTYYVRSSVVGGVPVVELNSFGIDTVNVYAAGQRIARDVRDNILFEHHNPVTGSWATSLGHSSYRTTNREEHDSFGAEIPTSNPYAYAQGYVDMKFGEPLFIEGSDPFDYRTGRTIDGLPVSEAEFQRRVGKDVGAGIFLNGKRAGFFDLAGLTSLSRITITFDLLRPPTELMDHSELWDDYYVRSFNRDIELNHASVQTGSARPQTPNAAVLSLVNQTLSSKRCHDFLQAVLGAASRKSNPVMHNGDIQLIFNDFLAQTNGGLSRSRVSVAPYGTASGTIGKDGMISSYLNTNNPLNQDREDASTIINELPHIAGTKGGWPNRQEYDDFALAYATHSTSYGSNFSLLGNYPMSRRFGKLAGRPKNPFADPSSQRNRDDVRWSNYFHNILRQECALPQ